jgi:hypothetical protein
LPVRGQLLNVDWWLGRDPVAFLRDSGEEEREPSAVGILGGSTATGSN